MINRAIERYLKKKPIAFHSPAHCGLEHPSDLSELTGLDDLQYPREVIKESQDFVAELFGAQKSFYLINGASVGIQAAILSVKKDKPLLVSRNIHKSVISGLILSGHQVEWLETEWLEDWAIYSKFTLDAKKDLKNYSAFICTNPSYEGIYSKLPELEIPVIVDEAHGAHYHFSDKLPKPALKCGADIVIQSWHKTLGSLTQTGVLHINKESKIPQEIIAANLRLLQTTSPSYLLLESLCSTAHKMKESGEELFKETINLANKINFPLLKNDDPLRAMFKIPGLNGKNLDDLFEEEGVALESHSTKAALAFINIGNKREDIENLNEVYKKIKAHSITENSIKNPNKAIFGEQKLNIRDAYFHKSKIVKSDEAIGKVCQELYAPCPPGIAVLVPGQIITKENLQIAGKTEISIVA